MTWIRACFEFVDDFGRRILKGGDGDVWGKVFGTDSGYNAQVKLRFSAFAVMLSIMQ
jgi:hypothetical protein